MKKFLVTLLVASMMLQITACGSKEEAAAESTIEVIESKTVEESARTESSTEVESAVESSVESTVEESVTETDKETASGFFDVDGELYEQAFVHLATESDAKTYDLTMKDGTQFSIGFGGGLEEGYDIISTKEQGLSSLSDSDWENIRFSGSGEHNYIAINIGTSDIPVGDMDAINGRITQYTDSYNGDNRFLDAPYGTVFAFIDSYPNKNRVVILQDNGMENYLEIEVYVGDDLLNKYDLAECAVKSVIVQ